jgi:hypothetical protein
MVALTSVVILVVIILYFSAQPVEKAPVVQAPVVKTQVQVPTVKDETRMTTEVNATIVYMFKFSIKVFVSCLMSLILFTISLPSQFVFVPQVLLHDKRSDSYDSTGWYKPN